MTAGSPFQIVADGQAPRISSLLIKPASAVCNLDCQYCFYLDRDADPYKDLPARVMTEETLQRLVDTYLFYSYPAATFAFQGGEPTLAGLQFFEKLVKFQKRYGRDGQSVSNALQTNGVLLDQDWCQLFREYSFLIGISIDGPEEVNDLYRFNKAGHGTWKRVMQGIEVMQQEKVDFNVLCVLSQSNVHKPRETYRFF
ncbi:MAG: radical SAM protein, partial [Candidatus Solibacter usitatus]|nr:radical SAM protein [Candidatus Solibacter usitatus]